MAKRTNGGIRQVEEESQRDYLDGLIKDFEREQTIQDVGTWLLNDTLDPLPPKHIKVLTDWLKTHNSMTIKKVRGRFPADTQNAFPYITRLHRDTGMTIRAACKLVAEELKLKTDPTDLRRAYDRARTPETRYLNDIVKATGAFSKTETPRSDIQKAGRRREKAKAAQKKSKEQQKRTQKP